MRNLLSPRHEKELIEFLETDPVIGFDYDGTLAPIVTHASQARMRAKTRKLLARLCLLAPCALMTGRARADALRWVGDLGFKHVIGNHGAEWGPDGPGTSLAQARRMSERTSRWVVQLEGLLQGLDGVFVEDKGLSLSIHYREARSRREALRWIEEALGHLRGARLIGGKDVFNVLPSEIGGKGATLLKLKRVLGRKTAFFAGDDLNDEEVFDLPARERVFKVRVGRSAKSRADYYLPTQDRMDSLLELLVEAALRRRKALAADGRR